MRRQLIRNAMILTSEKAQMGELLIEDDLIARITYYEENGQSQTASEPDASDLEIIDLGGLYLMAGGIDAHVHFRDPGLTHKADMSTESRAALLGGITSFIDMPNTNPVTTSWNRLQEKLDMAAEKSAVNYGFNLGATNSNAEEIKQLLAEGKGKHFGAIKVFMGSSTGNMLVDDKSTLDTLFSITEKNVFIHSEDETTIRNNMKAAVEKYGDDIPFEQHPFIRSRQACIFSTIKALETAMKYGTKLHVLHVSTAEELQMIQAAKLHNPAITAETSSNYLWFCDEDYSKMGPAVKCNPAIKSASDREALIKGLKEGLVDTIGSDHAPHLKEEKDRPYKTCPSGLPSIGQSLPALLTIAAKNDIELTRIAAVMSENIARIMGIDRRGKLAEGNFADLVAFDPKETYTLKQEDIAYKCGWSPYTGAEFTGKIKKVWVNGTLSVEDGKIISDNSARPLEFN